MKKFFWVIVVCCSSVAARADFTYTETTQMTGGSLITMMRALGPLAGRMRDPIISTHIIKGNRMATITKDNTSVIDIDKETITTIDTAKKTYSVMTFDEMKQRMQEAAQKMQGRQKDKNGDEVEAKFKVSAKATGQTKVVQGLTAKEMLVTMTMEGTNTKTGESGGMDMSMDSWNAPVPGYDEAKEFHKRLAAKMGNVFGSGLQQMQQMSMSQANTQQSFEEIAKEMQKIDGVPVESLIKMGASANAPSSSETCSAQPQTSQQPQQQQSTSSAVAGALAGRLPGFGGFGRKKKEDQPPAQEQPQASAQSQQGCSAAGTLMEMTMTLTSFSSAPADASKFEVPAGFKQVDARKQ